LVVLPFDNLSDDKAQGYLADGITDDLTTDLARMPDLFVISRNAAFGYKDKAVQPAQIGAELGVHYIIEGSVRRAGDNMRINAQLIDATTGGHVWADRVEGTWSDVFSLQDRVTDRVVSALGLRLQSSNRILAEESPAQSRTLTQTDTRGVLADPGGTINPDAYEVYLRGIDFKRRGAAADFAQAASLFEQAVTIDPNYGSAWAQLADIYWLSYGNPEREAALGIESDAVMDKVQAFLSESAKHPSPLHYVILVDQLVEQHKSHEAIAAAQRAIALDPSDADGYEGMAQALIYDGRPKDAKAFLEASYRVDPRETSWRTKSLGLAYFTMGHFEEAIATLEQLDPTTEELWHRFQSLFLLAAAHAHLGHAERAEAARKQLSTLSHRLHEANLSGLLARMAFPYKQESDADRLLDGLRMAGVPDLPFDDWNSPNRLTGTQIRSLIFDHELEGRDRTTKKPWRRRTAANGATEVMEPGRGWGRALSWIEGDTLCRWMPREGRGCYAIFRNPEGTFRARDEYVWLTTHGSLEFSIVK
jgi:TolB-like protein/tetratricopeptide (TPR) repeat protein